MLARDRRVESVSPDREVGATLRHAIPAVGTNAAQASGLDGRGIGIAVIDSGVSAHPDRTGDGCAQSKVVYRENVVPRSADVAVRGRQQGTGDHLECRGGNAAAPLVQFVGVARKAHLIDLRVLGWNSKGSDSRVIQAIERAIQLKSQCNIRVINLSPGRRMKESSARDPLGQAVDRA